jgi:ketosteroid isomerase-like protein
VGTKGRTLRGLISSLSCLCVLACAGAPLAPANRDELLATERAFSHRSVEVGPGQAFREYLAPDAVELLGGSPPTRGREAIAAALDSKSGGTALALRWEPEDAAVAASGDLGYTWGRYQLTLTRPGEAPTDRKGKYLTVWRKDPATHQWKAIADTGNPD